MCVLGDQVLLKGMHTNFNAHCFQVNAQYSSNAIKP